MKSTFSFLLILSLPLVGCNDESNSTADMGLLCYQNFAICPPDETCWPIYGNLRVDADAERWPQEHALRGYSAVLAHSGHRDQHDRCIVSTPIGAS